MALPSAALLLLLLGVASLPHVFSGRDRVEQFIQSLPGAQERTLQQAAGGPAADVRPKIYVRMLGAYSGSSWEGMCQGAVCELGSSVHAFQSCLSAPAFAMHSGPAICLLPFLPGL